MGALHFALNAAEGLDGIADALAVVLDEPVANVDDLAAVVFGVTPLVEPHEAARLALAVWAVSGPALVRVLTEVAGRREADDPVGALASIAADAISGGVSVGGLPEAVGSLVARFAGRAA